MERGYAAANKDSCTLEGHEQLHSSQGCVPGNSFASCCVALVGLTTLQAFRPIGTHWLANARNCAHVEHCKHMEISTLCCVITVRFRIQTSKSTAHRWAHHHIACISDSRSSLARRRNANVTGRPNKMSAFLTQSQLGSRIV